MRLARRDLLKLGAGVAGGAALGAPFPLHAEWSGGGVRSIGHSLLGETKYVEGFAHFDYVNPDAPKGGRARLSRSGQFDTFNSFNAKGSASNAVSYVLESLMTASLDEGSTHYGLLAEWMERPEDDSWVAFRLRDEALWHDGEPVTVDDVLNSFTLLTTQGHPFFRFYYQNVVEATDEGDRVVLFRFDQTGNRELPHIMGQLTILPKHWWDERDFTAATLEPLLGSGPYRISAFEAGRFVELRRVENHWGADLPVNVGAHNFDILRLEHFLDRDVEFEAFKKGEIDYWDENSAKRWAEKFDFAAAQSGDVIKREPALDGPKTVQGFVFNLRRPKFADRRVREALSLAFDFEWTNRSVFYDQYARPQSYFQGSDGLMAQDVPHGAELDLLEPFRDQLPPALFERPFAYPKTDGSGRPRPNLRRAQQLLRDAGFRIENFRLVDAEGRPLEIEFLAAGVSQQAVVLPYLRNLQKLGVATVYRDVDTAQYIRRRRSYDFDMLIGGWSNSDSPGNEQRDFWGASSAEQPGGRNLVGAANPVVDALIEKIVFAEDRDALEAATRALDRVLLWEHYGVLELYTPTERIAYWNRFGAPDPLPSRSVGFPDVWWSDPDKVARL